MKLLLQARDRHHCGCGGTPARPKTRGVSLILKMLTNAGGGEALKKNAAKVHGRRSCPLIIIIFLVGK